MITQRQYAHLERESKSRTLTPQEEQAMWEYAFAKRQSMDSLEGIVIGNESIDELLARDEKEGGDNATVQP